MRNWLIQDLGLILILTLAGFVLVLFGWACVDAIQHGPAHPVSTCARR